MPPRNARPAAKPRARAVWLRIHRWLGLVLGAGMALMGLTGSINVFTRELDAALHPALFAATRSTHPLGPTAAFDLAQRAVPEHVGFLYAPDAVWPVWTAFFHRDGSVWTLTIDPGTGHVLGIRDPHSSPIGLIYRLHSDLLLAPWGGEQVVGVLGLFLLIMAASGIWLWWPRHSLRAALTRLRSHPRQVLYGDLHALAGIWSAVLIIVVAVTGAGVVFPGLVRPIVALASPAAPTPPPHTTDPGRPPDISAERAVAIALAASPSEALRYVMRPEPSGHDGQSTAWQIGLRWQHGSTAHLVAGAIWVDPWSGAILAARTPEHASAGEMAMDSLLWIHNGSLFGWPGRILVFLSGLALPALFTTGLLFWSRKRRLRQVSRRLRGLC